MAIAATAGGAGSTTAAAALKALASFTLTVGRNVYVVVGLDSTATSVTSITDTKGNSYTLVRAKNGTGVRVELWRSLSVGAQVANIITINVSPNSNIAGGAEEYSGVSSQGNQADAAVASDANPILSDATQDGANVVIYGIAFPCVSGDTLTAVLGTERQKSIPAATAVGVALYDNTSVSDATIQALGRISTTRGWAMVAVELRSGGAAVTLVDYAATVAPALAADRDIRYLGFKMPPGGGESSGGGGAWPFVG